MADYMSNFRFTLTPSLGVIPCEYPYKWYTAENYILRATLQSHCRRMYRSILNLFYAIGPTSYRIRRNNANYTSISSFKVTQGYRLWYQTKAHATSILVISINIVTFLLSRTVSKLSPIISQIFAIDDITLTPSLGVIPCEYPDKLYLFGKDCSTRSWKPHDRIFIRLDTVQERDGRTDRITLAIQRSALRALRTRCKNCHYTFVHNFDKVLADFQNSFIVVLSKKFATKLICHVVHHTLARCVAALYLAKLEI